MWWSLRHNVIQLRWRFDISGVLLPEIQIEWLSFVTFLDFYWRIYSLFPNTLLKELLSIVL